MYRHRINYHNVMTFVVVRQNFLFIMLLLMCVNVCIPAESNIYVLSISCSFSECVFDVRFECKHTRIFPYDMCGVYICDLPIPVCSLMFLQPNSLNQTTFYCFFNYIINVFIILFIILFLFISMGTSFPGHRNKFDITMLFRLNVDF